MVLWIQRESHKKQQVCHNYVGVYLLPFFFWVYEIEGKAYSNAEEWKSPCLFKVAVQVDMNTHTQKSNNLASQNACNTEKSNTPVA